MIANESPSAPDQNRPYAPCRSRGRPVAYMRPSAVRHRTTSQVRTYVKYAMRARRKVGDPDGREITTPQQPRELQRVTLIGFDFIAGLCGDQRRRHDHAVNTQSGQLTVQRVARRTGLVGDAQLDLRATQPRHQLAHRRRLGVEFAVTGGRTGLLGDRHRNTGLMHVQTDVANLPMVHHAHWADLHVCSSTQDEPRPPAQPTFTACAGPSILTPSTLAAHERARRCRSLLGRPADATGRVRDAAATFGNPSADPGEGAWSQ